MMRLAAVVLWPTLCLAAGPASLRSGPVSFEKTVRPFLAKHCTLCHNEKLKTGGLNLDAYHDTAAALKDRRVWEKVHEKLRTGEMPPKGSPAPTAAEVQALARWIENQLDRLDRNTKPDPGRVTARRLNRYEYNNTIRDLLGVDFRPADDFPADDSGYGFDNIGDVLSLSPVLMEKYLTAAEKIARLAIAADPPPKPTIERYKAEQVRQPGGLEAKHRFLVEGEYEITTGLGGLRPEGSLPVNLALTLDDQQVQVFEVDPGRGKKRIFEARLPIKPGEHRLGASFLDDAFKPEDNPIAPRDRYLAVDSLEIRGPYNPVMPPPPESHRRIFACGHSNGQHQPGCARLIVSALARRAYRRPVTAQAVDRLAHFVEMAQQQGDTFEQGMRVALEAMLVSPHFLFRIEHDPEPNNPAASHRINDFELTSRLSYFLWSSMPDDALLTAAEQQRLRKPGALEAQVRRMLADPKSRALVDNFAGQWLELRNLETVKPDKDRFPNFDDELRLVIMRETKLFFEAVMREDRSILDFIDGKYTFLNERLAKHYGIAGVFGNEFRRVNLTGEQRSGVITQASVLTVSSYATRTSPVIRGKFLLENILGTPPPPPPPDVPILNEEAIGSTGTLKQQLEQHRKQPSCAICHSRMDALGFGLENYDAIGAWRTRDGKFPVDATGTLPNGKSFQGPAGLKTILRADRDSFARCLAEKMLTYALGRGLERYDQPAVNLIVRRLAASDYRFSRLIVEIVNSLPFEMRRGDGGTGGTKPAATLASSREKPR